MDWTPDRDLWIETAGAALEARVWGPPPDTAPTIVMLHEGLGCVALWRDFPKLLAAATGWGVMAWSRQGYGRSDPCALPRRLDYMTIEGEQVVPQVLDVIGFRRGVLLGHSDGGSIAALHSGRLRDHKRDDRVRGLILIAPHFFVEDCSIAAITAAREAFEAHDLRARLARHHDHVDAAFHGWNGAWLDPGFRDWDITSALRHIQVPVLAIQGLDDPYGTRAQVDVIGAEMQAPAEVDLLEGCKHAPHHEHPETVLSLIAGFLARIERTDPSLA
jgi:pimeloyl-ACP methyl ester carboxylesterase